YGSRREISDLVDRVEIAGDCRAGGVGAAAAARVRAATSSFVEHRQCRFRGGMLLSDPRGGCCVALTNGLAHLFLMLSGQVGHIGVRSHAMTHVNGSGQNKDA